MDSYIPGGDRRISVINSSTFLLLMNDDHVRRFSFSIPAWILHIFAPHYSHIHFPQNPNRSKEMSMVVFGSHKSW